MRRSAARLALAAAVLAGGALAQSLPDDLADVLAGLQPLQRAAILRHARAWEAWTPVQRDAFAARAAEWDRLPPATRAQRRAEWEAWRALPAVEQARLRDAAAAQAALDPASRQALRAQFEALDLSTQQGWRLGPSLGVDYPRLQPLLAQVPAGEEAALLRTLHAMSVEERDRLAVLVQRTPPQARAGLRRALVSTSDANRGGWLALQLER
ncbi:DUF3106 domain-containing protein [Cognatilysobacter segetis]|uniref:DUF3106 domain-containing protein n=1 Tax=Cognatilysobacter segetis TaxID=2492394 RepID=UPI0010613876|nr:DUF3106 domain-containing protein [Lysobacter segetis]